MITFFKWVILPISFTCWYIGISVVHQNNGTLQQKLTAFVFAPYAMILTYEDLTQNEFYYSVTRSIITGDDKHEFHPVSGLLYSYNSGSRYDQAKYEMKCWKKYVAEGGKALPPEPMSFEEYARRNGITIYY